MRFFLVYFTKFTLVIVKLSDKLLFTNVSNKIQSQSAADGGDAAVASTIEQTLLGRNNLLKNKLIKILNYLRKYMSIIIKYTNEKISIWIERFRILILPTLIYALHRICLKFW